MSLSSLNYMLFNTACWLATEVWSRLSRSLIVGLIHTVSNVGTSLVSVVSLLLNAVIFGLSSGLEAVLPIGWVDALLANQTSRFLMIVEDLPALLVFFSRAFSPESEKWQEEQAGGRTGHWAVHDLLLTVAGVLGVGGVIVVWSPVVSSPLVRGNITPPVTASACVGFAYTVRILRTPAMLGLGGSTPAPVDGDCPGPVP